MQKIEIPGITGKFGFGVQHEAGQRLIEFCQENALVIVKALPMHKTSILFEHYDEILANSLFS